MMNEKRFKTKYYLKSRQGVVLGVVKVNEEENVLSWGKVVDLLNSLTEENEQLKMLNSACKNGQRNLMKEMEKNEEALDKIWSIIKKLYGVIEDE